MVSIAIVVDAVVLAPGYPDSSEVLVMRSDRLLKSDDRGATWSDWKADRTFEHELVLMAAWQGLDLTAPPLAGTTDGGVVGV